MSEEEKADFVPPEQRKDYSSPLGPTELEYLDRLVKKGEGLVMVGLPFSVAETLLAKGYARIKKTYYIGGKKSGHEIQRIAPTAKGKELAHVRTSLHRVNEE